MRSALFFRQNQFRQAKCGEPGIPAFNPGAAAVDNFIAPALRGFGRSPEDIDLLLCTHTHGDHIGGRASLRELGIRRIGVLASGAEKLRNQLKYSKLIRAAFPEYSAATPAVLDGVDPDLLLCGGDTVGGLAVFAPPGHDTDCVIFFDTVTGTLLTGDSIQWNGTDSPGCALYMDLLGDAASLRKLAALDIGRIVPEHPYHPVAATAQSGPVALKFALDLLRDYDIFIQGTGDHPLPELARRLIEHVGGQVPDKLFLAMYTVREHLRSNGDALQQR